MGVTFQKAGTTWTQTIINQIHGYPPGRDVLEHCPWPEVALGPPLGPSWSAMDQLSPRCLKSHWPRRDHMARLPPTSRVVYVIRRVERVVESYFHHILGLSAVYGIEGTPFPFDDFFEMFLRGESENGDY